MCVGVCGRRWGVIKKIEGEPWQLYEAVGITRLRPSPCCRNRKAYLDFSNFEASNRTRKLEILTFISSYIKYDCSAITKVAGDHAVG